MSAIAKAIGPLVNIALLLLFAIIIFAIIGLEFYAGALNKTCYDIQNLGEILRQLHTVQDIQNLGETISNHPRHTKLKRDIIIPSRTYKT
jgi:hypothetical protein